MPNITDNLRFPIRDQDLYNATVTFEMLRQAPAAVDVNQGAESSDDQILGDNGVISQTKVVDNPPRPDGRQVKLYLPQAIQIADAASYNNTNLGTLGAVAEQALLQGGGIVSAAGQSLYEAGKSVINSFKGSMDTPLGKLAAVRTVEKVGIDGITGAVKSVNRVTVNPNTRALFDSVPLREFSFTFKMIAQSREEAEAIKDIIKYFRTELYPATFGDPKTNVSVGYQFPDLFNIRFAYLAASTSGRVEKPIATKIKPSYLKSVNTVYNAGSMGMHADGNFTEVDLTLTFIEAKALRRSDIGEGF
jgi:hypothetical protein